MIFPLSFLRIWCQLESCIFPSMLRTETHNFAHRPASSQASAIYYFLIQGVTKINLPRGFVFISYTQFRLILRNFTLRNVNPLYVFHTLFAGYFCIVSTRGNPISLNRIEFEPLLGNKIGLITLWKLVSWLASLVGSIQGCFFFLPQSRSHSHEERLVCWNGLL